MRYDGKSVTSTCKLPHSHTYSLSTDPDPNLHQYRNPIMTPHNPILYQNIALTTIIIDIPASIAQAQGPPSSLNPKRKLLSTEPSREPFASTEPKSEKAKKNLADRCSVDQVAGNRYAVLINKVTEEVRGEWEGGKNWCLERKFAPMGKKRKRKRGEKEQGNELKKEKVGEASDNPSEFEQVTQGEKFTQDEDRLAHTMKGIEREKLDSFTITIASSAQEKPNETDTEEIVSWDGSWYNEYPHPIQITITEKKAYLHESLQPMEFHIPPLSTFLLSDCANSSQFRNTVRSLSSTYSTPRAFDFVLLDPPWPNASARRKSSYSTASQLRDLKRLLLDMDLDTYIAPSGYVGIWITNAPAIRNLVLSDGGLFDAWNVGLVEEWIWVKTTISGDPVTSIEGMWRKPYEVLLLGRAPETRLEVARTLEEENVVKRVIFGVPDLHSRKPCLKSLFEGMQIVKKTGRVLEVFARYCVAGWWSWGNEVLKFNWAGYWQDDDIDPTIMQNFETTRTQGR